ncbi:diguanylate cyclase/phosphodiesterase (GGDEF & EAL domains) with PAS/PAC sensor [Minicystis rosea]|nr:diguanylate cyclase/phosphodiesterase (GGDEF & EAL domains) with PAS/PAC sensor [Minicystis rosea]
MSMTRVHAPRPTVPSVIPDDEEREDTLATALAPLRAAELGPIGPASDPMRTTALPPTLPAADTSEPSIVVEPLTDLRPSRPEPETTPTGLEACLSHIGVAVIETDAAGTVLGLNVAAERLTGWPGAEAAGMPLDDVFSLRAPDSESPEAMLEATLGIASAEHTALLERRDGRVIPVRHVIGTNRARPDDLADTLPGSTGQLVVFRDVSGQQLIALQLARQARYDALTGLLNRKAFTERVGELVDAGRGSRARHVLCYFDLDRFRLVNATCGHDAGDDLLQWVATRLHEFVGPNDAVGRIGGDEFALLLANREAREGERVARELQKRLLEFRFGWEDKTFAVGASFGLVAFGAETSHAAEVLAAADHACRVAKDAGRGRIQLYRDNDDQVTQSRRSIQWVAGMQRNLEEGRLRLFAQNIHPLAIRGPVGAHFEILVRIVDEAGRFQSPVGIIQAAEHSGMMDTIDRFVVKQAFRTIGALPQKAMRRLDTCAINLSGVSLLREGLLDFIVQEMNRANVPPSKICFEITETAALANLGEVLWVMQELGAMGCRFAIDDFGSGHASYGYIETLPVDYVKIDGVFVRDLTDNALHRAIVESVHRIGCTLGIKTVAESVETQAIADLLEGIGVDYAQGWLYGKPQPLGDVCAALEND